MRRRGLTAGLVVVAVLGGGCGGEDEGAASPPAAASVPASTAAVPPQVASAATLRRAVADVRAGRARLVDVRTQEEWDARHAAGAEHLPLADIRAGARTADPGGRPTYVYCRTGRRAAEAIALLRAAGWSDPLVNAGALAAWEQAGGEVTR